MYQFFPEPSVSAGIGLCQEDQVYVRTVVQLSATQLAERQDDESVWDGPRPLSGEVQARPHYAFRQVGELFCHSAKIPQIEQVACPDAQQFMTLIATQGVSFLVERGRSPDRGACAGVEIDSRFRPRQIPLTQKQWEVLRVAEEYLREKLAAGEEGHQVLHSPWRRCQDVKQRCTIWHAQDEPRESAEYLVGVLSGCKGCQ